MREIGAQWAVDRAGFARVSVASARLQSVMRDLTRAHMTMPYASGGVLPQAVLVVVPEREQHTIGALAVASQLFHVAGRLRLEERVLEERSLLWRRDGRVDVLQRERRSFALPPP